MCRYEFYQFCNNLKKYRILKFDIGLDLDNHKKVLTPNIKGLYMSDPFPFEENIKGIKDKSYVINPRYARIDIRLFDDPNNR